MMEWFFLFKEKEKINLNFYSCDDFYKNPAL